MLKEVYKFIHNLPLLWAVSGMFAINGGDKILVAIITLSILTKLIGHLTKVDRIEINFNVISIILLCMVIYSTFKYYTNGYSSSEIRVLISSFLYALISFPKKIPVKSLITITCLTSLFVLLQTIYIMAGTNWDRMQLPLNAIPYANYSALISLGAFLSATFIKDRKLKLALICTVLFYTIVVLVVDTRGTWLALISAYSSIAILFILKTKSWRMGTYILLSFLFVFIGSYPIIKDRIDSSITEINLLLKGDFHSSWGIRVQLLKAGYDIFSESPSITGLGQTAHIEIIQNMFKKGEVEASLANFDNKNFHNSIVDRTVKYGVIGLSLYLSIILIPFIIGLNHTFGYKSLILVSFPIFIFIAGLSYIPLSHPGTYFVYLFTLISLFNKNEINGTGDNG